MEYNISMKKNENMNMVMWDYKDTELPFNTTHRSSHMKDMGGKGWELVSVSSNPESRCHVFFWKRPQNLDIKNGKDLLQPNVSKFEDQNVPLEAGKVSNDGPISSVTYKSNREISDHEYKKFPDPQVVMIVKYRPKDGCFDQFRTELYTREYPNVITRHMGFNKKNEFVCVSFMESIDAALDLEGVGTSWLDSVDHLLIKYPNGSRTESFSGPVWGWFPNHENLSRFSAEAKAFTVLVVKMKDSFIQEVKDIVLQPSILPRNLFSCVAQYKDTDDTFIYIGIDTVENKQDANIYYSSGCSRPITSLIIPEMSFEFFSDAEDFVWINSKYF